MRFDFDHLVIGADTLAQGGAWARETLKADVPAGGAHPSMATHNLLARLPVGYLEIIAVDPEATPTRPRWYGLDDADIRARLKERPRAIAWVLAVDDIDAAAEQAAWDVGEIVEASRGDLSWRISVAADGSVAEGVLPALIEWPEHLGRAAPTGRMADLGFVLRSLRLHHPEPSRIERLLASVQAAEAMAAAGASLYVRGGERPAIEAMLTPPNVDLVL